MEPTASPSPAKPRRSRLRTARAFSITVPRIAHGYSSHLIVTLYPTGAIEIAEARHREPPVLLDLGCLYVESRIAEAKRKIVNR
jgi:hypothetical protein